MEKTVVKKQNLGGYIISIILLFLVIIGMMFYIMYDKGLFNTNVVDEETINNNDAKLCVDSLKFDVDKIVNKNSGGTYKIVLNDVHMDAVSVMLDSNKKDVIVSILDNGIRAYTVSGLSKNVEDIYGAGMGLDIGDYTLFFLLEDGSIEYLNLYNAISSSNMHISGKIDDLSGVVKFYYASVSYETVGGYRTVLAQKADGTIYDLYDLMK